MADRLTDCSLWKYTQDTLDGDWNNTVVIKTDVALAISI